MNAFDPDARDPGLAAERTDLAWSRGYLSLLACSIAVWRGALRPSLHKADVTAGAVLLALGAVTAALGSWHVRHARTRGARRTTGADLLPIAVGVAAVGIAAFVLAAVAPR